VSPVIADANGAISGRFQPRCHVWEWTPPDAKRAFCSFGIVPIPFNVRRFMSLEGTFSAAMLATSLPKATRPENADHLSLVTSGMATNKHLAVFTGAD